MKSILTAAALALTFLLSAAAPVHAAAISGPSARVEVSKKGLVGAVGGMFVGAGRGIARLEQKAGVTKVRLFKGALLWGAIGAGLAYTGHLNVDIHGLHAPMIAQAAIFTAGVRLTVASAWGTVKGLVRGGMTGDLTAGLR
jgi:hypothetical protein